MKKSFHVTIVSSGFAVGLCALQSHLMAHNIPVQVIDIKEPSRIQHNDLHIEIEKLPANNVYVQTLYLNPGSDTFVFSNKPSFQDWSIRASAGKICNICNIGRISDLLVKHNFKTTLD